jgi:hypothetical protein
VDNIQKDIKTVEVRILAKIWEEDKVWNVSAFDLPVVSFGNTMREAQKSFEDAVESHFMALADLHRIESTVRTLQNLALQRDFYEARMTPHVTVQNFPYSPVYSSGLCHAGV